MRGDTCVQQLAPALHAVNPPEKKVEFRIAFVGFRFQACRFQADFCCSFSGPDVFGMLIDFAFWTSLGLWFFWGARRSLKSTPRLLDVAL